MYISKDSTSVLRAIYKEVVYQTAKFISCTICGLESFFFHWYLYYFYKHRNSFNEKLILEQIRQKVFYNVLCPNKRIAELIRDYVTKKEEELE